MNDLETQLRAGEDALNSGQFVQALTSFTELTRAAPRSVGAWCGRAAACYGLGDIENALAAAEQAVQLAPDDSRGFFVLAPPAFALGAAQSIEACRRFMSRLSRDDGEMLANFWAQRLTEKDYFAHAASAFGIFAARHMDDALIALEMAHLHLNAFDHDKTEAILDDAENRYGASAQIYTMRARMALTRGESEAAKAAALRAIEMNGRAVPAYVVLSDVAPDLIDAEKEAQLSSIVVDETFPDSMRIGGHRALGRAKEKKGDHDGAFSAFAAAKTLSKQSAANSGLTYNHKTAEAAVRSVLARYPAVDPPQGGDHAAPAKIFVIGMPRSGSTLIDQILSRHSQAESVGESLIIPRIANLVERTSERDRRPYRTCAREMRENYRKAYAHAANGAACIIDKNLFNFERCGLIADLDTNARFILTSRDPADIALSIFKTKFLAAHEWSNDLRDIAHRQASFEFLTDHWRRILGDRLMVVRHEDLVADFEPSVRKLLEFCGLDYEPECLAFHEGERQVFTISAAQVRRPLNADGVGRWRRYEKHLAPYFQSLDEYRKRFAGGL